MQLSIKEVEDRIAVIRNYEVIADADVAFLYGVETDLRDLCDILI